MCHRCLDVADGTFSFGLVVMRFISSGAFVLGMVWSDVSAFDSFGRFGFDCISFSSPSFLPLLLLPPLPFRSVFPHPSHLPVITSSAFFITESTSISHHGE